MQAVAADAAEDHEALLQFMYMAPVGLTQTAMDGEVLMMNPLSAQLLMPLSRDGTLDNLFTALEGVSPELRHLAADFGQSHGKICDALHIQVSAGVRGKSDPQILSLTLLKLDEGRLMAVLSDVTQQVKRERMLKQGEAWFNAVLSGVTDYALVSLDHKGCIFEWNASIARVTGFNSESCVGRPYSIFYPADSITQERMLDRLGDADGNGWSLDEGWRCKSDGSLFWGSVMVAPLRERDVSSAYARLNGSAADEPAYCLILRDISDKRDASENFRKAASCDHLTGIANRRAFYDNAEIEIERWRRSPRELSLILFDVDHFKRVNDTHGHAAGDAVLRHLASLMTENFRQVDVIARVGGEEFAVLLPATDIAQALLVANRLRKALELQPVHVDGVDVHCTISGGVAHMEAGVAGLDALMKMADVALYAAKTGGRNRVEHAAAYGAHTAAGQVENQSAQ